MPPKNQPQSRLAVFILFLCLVAIVALVLLWPKAQPDLASSDIQNIPPAVAMKPAGPSRPAPSMDDQLAPDPEPTVEVEPVDDLKDAPLVTFELHVDVVGGFDKNVDITALDVCGSKRLVTKWKRENELTSTTFKSPAAPCEVRMKRQTLYGVTTITHPAFIPEEGGSYTFVSPVPSPQDPAMLEQFLVEQAAWQKQQGAELDQKILDEGDPIKRRILVVQRSILLGTMPELNGDTKENWRTLSTFMDAEEDEIFSEPY